MHMLELFTRIKIEATQDVLERAGIREYEIVPDPVVDGGPPRFYIRLNNEKDQFLYRLRGEAYFQKEIAKEVRMLWATHAEDVSDILSKNK